MRSEHRIADVPMPHVETITVLTTVIAALGSVASAIGIFSGGGPGPYSYESVRGHDVRIYGIGVYRHMSAEVAPQGIAQDYVTLLVGVPLLLGSLAWARHHSLRGRILLAGVLGYFLVTYLFYLMMAMYNALFLLYVALLSASFFALALTLLGFDIDSLAARTSGAAPVRRVGGFLVFSATAIALLWLSIVVPPLMDGTVIPLQVEHYTTLVVQGLDLALMLPLALVSGTLVFRKRPFGYLLGPVYLVFLALLMTALTAKVVAMGMSGYDVVPTVFIIPAFTLSSLVLAVLSLRCIDPPASSDVSA